MLHRLMRRWFTHPEDSDDVAQRTVIFAVFNMCILLLAGNAIVQDLHGVWVYRAIVITDFAATLAVLLRLAWTRRLTMQLIVVAVGSTALGIAVNDVNAMGYFLRFWPAFVVLIDALLVLDAPGWITRALVVYVVVHLVVTQVEFDYRFGLLDLEGIASERRLRYIEQRVNCERPPCRGESLNISALLFAISIFLLDFHWTRGFASALRKEKKAMEEAIALAQGIADCLARFDLAAAETQLQAAAETSVLPEAQAASFKTLLENLTSYRPYLPDELFGTPDDAALAPGSPRRRCSVDGDVPGMRGECARVALVFTDVRSSTALWEANAEAMGAALGDHFEVLRTALAMHSGYEVKTIGDALMAAFHTAADAVWFGHAAQGALGAIRWAEELAHPNPGDGFAALSVRMGVHWGEDVTPQRNTLTDRYDFFGPTVNLTARVEPLAAPQTVTVTAAVMEEVGGPAALAEKFIVLAYAEARSGKGLKEPLVLTALLPRELAGLEEAVRRMVCVKASASSGGAVWPAPVIVSTPTASSRGSLPSFSRHTGRVSAAARSQRACVGVVAFDPAGTWGDMDARVMHAGQRLEALRGAVAETRGHLSCVVNGVSWVSWGLHGKRVLQCANESTRCAMMLAQKLVPAPPPLRLESGGGAAPPDHMGFHAGLVTGPLATVELAAGGRRFVTPYGESVAAAERLCRHAGECRRRVLVADLSEDNAMGSHAEQVGHVVPVPGLCIERAEAGAAVTVHELDLRALSKAADEMASSRSQSNKARRVHSSSTSAVSSTMGVEVMSIGGSTPSSLFLRPE
eukprot:TRINITY_DN3479_c1_g1_i1.p1 TRINITY_DN3479_c1_g1~~TRINITY_DN3479_c1_g1_i1.p1  ORF type:complete len:803 (+),score=237.84 TRINITY_DN3479_c1_g1_i1:111-2519(+)